MANPQYDYGQVTHDGQQKLQSNVPAQSTTVMVTNSSPQRNARKYGYFINRSCIKGMGVAIIIIGILCVLFQVVASSLYFDYYRLAETDGYVWTGAWVGAWFIMTGVIGIVSANTDRGRWIIAFMILNIISCSIFSWVMLSMAGASLGTINECSYNYYFNPSCDPPEKVGMAMNSLLIISSLVLFVISLVASIIGCFSTCCADSPRQAVQSGAIVAGSPPYTGNYAHTAIQFMHVSQCSSTQPHMMAPPPHDDELPPYSNYQPNNSYLYNNDSSTTPAPQYTEKAQ